MLLSESELNMYDADSILDEAVLLDESESITKLQAIPVVENSRLGGVVVNLSDLDSIVEDYDCSYEDAFYNIAEQNELDPNHLAVAVEDYSIIETPELVDLVPNIVVKPISEDNIVYQFVDDCINEYYETGDEGYLDCLDEISDDLIKKVYQNYPNREKYKKAKRFQKAVLDFGNKYGIGTSIGDDGRLYSDKSFIDTDRKRINKYSSNLKNKAIPISGKNITRDEFTKKMGSGIKKRNRIRDIYYGDITSKVSLHNYAKQDEDDYLDNLLKLNHKNIETRKTMQRQKQKEQENNQKNNNSSNTKNEKSKNIANNRNETKQNSATITSNIVNNKKETKNNNSSTSYTKPHAYEFNSNTTKPYYNSISSSTTNTTNQLPNKKTYSSFSSTSNLKKTQPFTTTSNIKKAQPSTTNISSPTTTTHTSSTHNSFLSNHKKAIGVGAAGLIGTALAAKKIAALRKQQKKYPGLRGKLQAVINRLKAKLHK